MRPRADTLLVWTGAPCVNGCAACPIDPRGAPDGVTVAGLRTGLAGGREPAGSLVLLVGGEPLLRPDILRLIAVIRTAGCLPGLVTTGRPLVYRQMRERLRRAGLAYLRVQFFGFGASHDQAAAEPGAFDQALAGLREWIEEGGGEVDAALTLRGSAWETAVSEIEALGRALLGADVQLLVGFDAEAERGATDLKAVRRVVDACAGWNDDPARPLLVWEGLPRGISGANAPSVPRLRAAFVAAEPSACCAGAVERLERAVVSRREAVRANSFNYVRRDAHVPWTPAAEACTAHAAADVELHRHLWLVEGDRLVLHITDTADFTPGEIVRVKDELSHLFVDRAPAGVLDDFTDGMRRVLPDPVCGACGHRAHCGRRYQVVEGAPFAREEAWIAAHIAGLRGRVLDVGCGEMLYRDQLAPLVRAGEVDYTGLDPDQVSLDRIRAALPGGRFHLGGIEDFRARPASYDHILCLRSLNHVVDLDEALAHMADLLKPGGALLIVECTPFAMLRRPEQVAAADRAPRAGHQHFRNVASEDVLPSARRHALHVLEHHPATLQTTNEWILLLGRALPDAA